MVELGVKSIRQRRCKAGRSKASAHEQRLLEGAPLVRETHQPRLPVARDPRGWERPHVRRDDVAFSVGQGEVPLRLLEGPQGMLGRVALVDGVMPVVQVVVVQEGAPDELVLADAHAHPTRPADGLACHPEDMIERRDPAMLDVPLHLGDVTHLCDALEHLANALHGLVFRRLRVSRSFHCPLLTSS